MRFNIRSHLNVLTKRIVSCVLALCIIGSLLPLSAAAAEPSGAIQSNCSHQYLSDVDILIGEDGEEYPGFEFQTEQADYSGLQLRRFVPIKLGLTRTAEHSDLLWVQILYDDGKKYSAHRPDTLVGSKEVVLVDGDVYGNYKELYTELALDTAHTFSLVVGPDPYDPEVGIQESDDVYTFHFTILPGLDGMGSSFLEVVGEDEWEDIVFDSPLSSFDASKAFLADLKGEECIFRARTTWTDFVIFPDYWEEAHASYRIGTDATWQEHEIYTDIEFNLPRNETTLVQLKVASDANNETIYSFEFTQVSDLAPRITTQPVDIACNKGQTKTLSVDAESVVPDMEVAFQWQKATRSSIAFNMFEDIPGATSKTYSPPTDWAETYYYRCVATVTVDGKPYSTTSDTARCTIQLTRVEDFRVIRELGSFIHRNSSGRYRTEYREGESFNPIYIGLQPYLEQGADYKFEVLCGETDSIENAIPYESAEVVSIGAGVYGEEPDKVYAIQDSGKLPVGEHYIFLKTTVVKVSNHDIHSNTIVNSVKLTYKPNEFSWPKTGSGTAEDPYRITEASDLEYIRMVVNDWNDRLTGKCFRFEADVTLPADWTPIGGDSAHGLPGRRVFSGQIDGGGHTLTVPDGGKPLFNYVSATVIKNLNIYGKRIDGCGLIDSYFVDYGLDNDYSTGCPETATLENVHLLAGSSTRCSGFMAGSGSGANTVTLRNCTVAEGVVIGYDGTESSIGSFVGVFNGQMENCYSAATVKGVHRVGGLAGGKGQSMGLCRFTNCGFTGAIEATDWAGGIIASGYNSDSAPNTMVISFNNCFVKADITAQDYVGGIIGGEGGVQDAWNKCILSNSTFYGTINSTGANVGGIIGYYNGVNTLQEMENNYFCELTGGRTLGVIGRIGSYNIGSGKAPFASQAAADEWYANTGKAIEKDSYDAEDVVQRLNSGSTSLKNWVVGTEGKTAGFPVHSTEPILIRLQINGTWPEQQQGQELDKAGITYTGIWTDGTTRDIPAADVIIIGYDKDKHGIQTLTAVYQGIRQEFTVTVKRPDGKIMVSFALKGDTAHGEPTSTDPNNPTGTHTLAQGGLTDWIAATEVEVSSNATVLDVIKQVLEAQTGHTYVITNGEGNYISAITRDGEELAEFTNGNKSGWMYTLNEKYSDLAVSEQFLDEGDRIVFYYTDDFTLENISFEKPGDDGPGTTVTEYGPYLTGVLSWLKANVPSPKVSSTSSEWAVLAQARGGALADAAKQEYLANLWQHADERGGVLHELKYTEYSRVILALTSIGVNASAVKNGTKTYNFVQPLLDKDCAQVMEQGINGTTFALIALDSHNYLSGDSGKKARATWIDELCKSQKDDGRWSIDDPKSDIDITAMAVQALARYYSMADSEYRQIGAQTAQSVLKEKVDRALTYLKGQQSSTNGGFGSPESDAQVIVALSALKQDAGQYKKDGSRSVLSDLLSYAVGTAGANTPVSFSRTRGGQTNQMATEQAAYALVAYERFSSSKKSLYDMTDVTLSSADLNIKLTQYTITVSAGANGAISPGTTTVTKGGNKTFAITPNPGYQIKDVKADNVSIGAPSTHTFTNVTSDHTISAEFEKANGTFTITAGSSTGGGTISPGTATVAAGGSWTFTITPFTGYKIVDVKVDGYSLGAQTSYTFTNVTSNHTITASFALTSDDITVYFTLMGDSSHGSSSNVHTLSNGGLQTWISRQAVTVSKGAKVYDVFTKVLNRHGYRYIGAEQNYVETIITPGGVRLSEFTNGRNSGWMYTVNGIHPELGLQERTVYNGDEIIWHYTDDYTQERGGTGGSSTAPSNTPQLTPTVSGTNAVVSSGDFSNAITAALNANSGTILVSPAGSAGASTLTVNLPTSTLYTAANSGLGVTVQSGAGTVVIPSGTLTSLANAARGSQLSITTTSKNSQLGVDLLSGRADVTAAQLANSSVTEVTMALGSQNITSWGGRSITISLPVSGTNFSAGNRYTVYQISSNGSVETHSGYCSRQNGSLYVEVSITHLSTFVTVPNQTSANNTYLPFRDVSVSDWFYDDVAYAYHKDLFNGNSSTTFAPYMKMNRAMLVTVLHRFEGTPAVSQPSGFTDVAPGRWYTNGAAWAGGVGVVNGKGNGKFDPYGNITREEIATILYRYAKIKGWDVTASANLYSFNDGARTSDWAARAMQWACAKGIINGKGGGTLDPGGYATRAEVAAMMRRFIEAY